MFFRQKRSGNHVYLQIVENHWEKGRSKQRVIATVGRLDQLRESGQIDGLLQSGAKFAKGVMVVGLWAAVGGITHPASHRAVAGRSALLARHGTHPLPDGAASVVPFRQRSGVRVGVERGLRDP